MPYQDANDRQGKNSSSSTSDMQLLDKRSWFIPASISPAYALGMMQIMPFLVKHLA